MCKGLELNYQQANNIEFYASTNVNAEQKTMSLQNLDIGYYHSFNNTRRGFYLGAGISQTVLKFDENNEEQAGKFKALNFLFAFGYEYQISPNFIISLSTKIPNRVNVSLASQAQKDLLYKKLPSNWDTKSAAYQATNRHKYYITDYYFNEKTITISEIVVTVNYIF